MKKPQYFALLYKRGTQGPHCIQYADSQQQPLASIYAGGLVTIDSEYGKLPTSTLRQLCDLADRFQQTWEQLLPLRKRGGWTPLPEAYDQLPCQVELTEKATAQRPYPEVVASAQARNFADALTACEQQLPPGKELGPAPSGAATHLATYAKWEDGQWVEVPHRELPGRDYLFKQFALFDKVK